MGKGNGCSTPGCKNPKDSRGLCTRHYGEAYRRRALPPMQLTLFQGIGHSLSNVNLDLRTADCLTCGPGVRIRVRKRQGGGGGVYCRQSGRNPNRNPNRNRGNQKRTPAQHRRDMLRRKYGMTEADYAVMKSAQGGKCAICAEPGELCVDHCHATGRIRGLLCRSCNLALGYLRDDPNRLLSAIDYLAKI